MTNEIITNEILSDEQLNQISGGKQNIIRNKDVYEECGIKVDEGILFDDDKFYYNGKKISDLAATAIVFYKMTVQDPELTKNVSIDTALNYKSTRLSEYKEFIKGINA